MNEIASVAGLIVLCSDQNTKYTNKSEILSDLSGEWSIRRAKLIGTLWIFVYIFVTPLATINLLSSIIIHSVSSLHSYVCLFRWRKERILKTLLTVYICIHNNNKYHAFAARSESVAHEAIRGCMQLYVYVCARSSDNNRWLAPIDIARWYHPHPFVFWLAKQTINARRVKKNSEQQSLILISVNLYSHRSHLRWPQLALLDMKFNSPAFTTQSQLQIDIPFILTNCARVLRSRLHYVHFTSNRCRSPTLPTY